MPFSSSKSLTIRMSRPNDLKGLDLSTPLGADPEALLVLARREVSGTRGPAHAVEAHDVAEDRPNQRGLLDREQRRERGSGSVEAPSSCGDAGGGDLVPARELRLEVGMPVVVDDEAPLVRGVAAEALVDRPWGRRSRGRCLASIVVDRKPITRDAQELGAVERSSGRRHGVARLEDVV